uniref:adenylate cyclase n=1 Tax=Poecilia formosa TaxID=48698 RepID=A0A096MF57_POEFO
MLLLYSVLHVRLYASLMLGLLYSVLFETLGCLLPTQLEMFSWLGPAKALLHLCAHAIGIHLFVMSEVRSRSTFLKVGQAIMHGKDLEVEKALKERMIHSVMPRIVADELMKQGDEEIGDNCGQIIFRPFNMKRMDPVSILFADIVGFTNMSANKSAHALVGLLNDLFGRFDRLCELTGCEKISTLGDCYYCVAGCPEPRPDHAYCCVEMGLGMIQAIEQFCQEKREMVNMRVGVHTGTVLCGILGMKRFKFDVWSNDVNLANLMEQLGVAGKVHLSQATFDFLDDRYQHEDGQYSKQTNKSMRSYHIQTPSFPQPRQLTLCSPAQVILNLFKTCNMKHTGLRFPLPVSKFIYSENNCLSLQSKRNCKIILKNHSTQAISVTSECNYKRLMIQQTLIIKSIESLYTLHLVTMFDLNKQPSMCIFKWSRNASESIKSLLTCVFQDILFLLAIRKVHPFSSSSALMVLYSFMIISHSGTVIVYIYLCQSCIPKRRRKKKCCSWIQGDYFLPNSLTKSQTLNIRNSVTNVEVCLSNYFLAFVNETFNLSVVWLGLNSYPYFFAYICVQYDFSSTSLARLITVFGLCIRLINKYHCCFVSSSVVESFFRSTSSDQQPNFDPHKRLIPEACVAFFLLLLLVWFLNREFEVSYRLHYHGNVEADQHRIKIQNMRDQADWLLRNIIPIHVAEQLKVSQSYSKNHDNVGVIFASIVNFSEFYEESYEGGKECYRVLNELIGDFDELLRKPAFANIEKIKTIGATYMAAAGLNTQQCADAPHPQEHLRALFEFALEMMRVVDDFNKNMLGFGFKLRIGFNHGPLTAGVIGTTKLLYDIWGDTVNIASRMDTTGVECRVQVSEESYCVLSGMDYEFDYRGTVNVKGKGQMKTFL